MYLILYLKANNLKSSIKLSEEKVCKGSPQRHY